MELIPSSAPHWHLLLNHFPSVGSVFAVGLLLSALYLKSEDLTQASLILFVILALLAIPTFVSGAATRWAIEANAGISSELIAAHQDAAVLALIALLITGWLAWFSLWQHRRLARRSSWSLPAVLVMALVSLLSMAQVGGLGGDINHPEIRAEGLATGGADGMGRAAAIEAYILDQSWAWPTMEAAHFIGMAMLFGVVVLVAIRVFGIGKSVPFPALHRLLPLGVFGFMINVITGMLFFVADSGRYTAMTNSFYPKMGLIVIGGTALLYFTMFERPWELKRDDVAPMTAKLVAAATVLMWSGVIVYGRLLPYLAGG